MKTTELMTIKELGYWARQFYRGSRYIKVGFKVWLSTLDKPHNFSDETIAEVLEANSPGKRFVNGAVPLQVSPLAGSLQTMTGHKDDDAWWAAHARAGAYGATCCKCKAQGFYVEAFYDLTCETENGISHYNVCKQHAAWAIKAVGVTEDDGSFSYL